MKLESKKKELPKGWKLTTLGEVFALRGGGTPDKKKSHYWNGDIPWASVKDIKNDYQHTTIDSITLEGLENSASTLAAINELILITRISPGVSSIVKKEMAINQDLKVVTCPESMPPEFAHYLFKTLKKEIISLSSGTTVLGIRLTELKNISFPLPPLDEQKRIVAKIEELFSELDAGEQSLRDARKQLTLYRQSLLKQAFEGKLTETWRQQNPDKLQDPKTLLAHIQQERESRHQHQIQDWKQATAQWEENGKEAKKPTKPIQSKLKVSLATDESDCSKITLDTICHKITDGEHFKPPVTDKGIYFLSAKDVREDGVSFASPLYISEETAQKALARCNPEHGDILIVSRGATVGRMCRVQTRSRFCLLGSVILLKPVTAIDSTFLCYALKSPRINKELVGLSGSTAQQAIYLRDIKNVKLPAISLPEQQEIVRLLDEQFTAIEQNEKEIDHALTQSQALRQSILKKAFCGKLL